MKASQWNGWKQRYALVVFHIATGRWNTRVVAGALPSGALVDTRMLLARVWPRDRDDNAVALLSLRLDTFVCGTFRDRFLLIFRLSTLGTCSRRGSSDCCCQRLNVRSHLFISDLAEYVLFVNIHATEELTDAIYSLSNLCKFVQ
jgi:hypothetical protein